MKTLNRAKRLKTNYRIKHRLTFMELPQRVVAVEEDDESDQVDEKQPDDVAPCCAVLSLSGPCLQRRQPSEV